MIARRHEGTRARRHEGGFSLIEVLMAIVILGIGMISIAALFPAGIAQQRKSVDDVMGPVVANNALAVLRSKLRPEDFGFLPPAQTVTIEGDFGWSRPAFIKGDSILPGGIEVPAGSIDVFGGIPTSIGNEVPFNGVNPPTIIINQFERYYPMGSVNGSNPFPAKPQYVWDCMFRRFQGRVQVALFVYRVAIPGGGTSTYTVALNLNSDDPPLPFHVPLDGSAWDADIVEILGTQPGSGYDPSNQADGWQAPGQWILDQNNNIHRVLAGRRNLNDGPVELLRPVPRLPSDVDKVFIYHLPGGSGSGVVTDIWYIPPVDASDERLSLTPVYVTVREL